MPKPTTRRPMKSRRPRVVLRRKGMVKMVKKIVRQTAVSHRQIRHVTSASLNTDAAIALGATHLVTHLTNVPSGDEINQREGPRITPRGVKYILTLANNGEKCRGLRVCILSPKSVTLGDLGTSTLPDVFMNVNFTATAYDKLSATGLFPLNVNKYRIFHDRIYRLLPETESVSGSRTVKRYIPIRKFKTLYSQADATDVNPDTGKLYLIAMLFEFDNTPTINTNVINMWSQMYYSIGGKYN